MVFEIRFADVVRIWHQHVRRRWRSRCGTIRDDSAQRPLSALDFRRREQAPAVGKIHTLSIQHHSAGLGAPPLIEPVHGISPSVSPPTAQCPLTVQWNDPCPPRIFPLQVAVPYNSAPRPPKSKENWLNATVRLAVCELTVW